MSPSHRRYLLLEQGVGAGIVNYGLNALIAWGMFRSAETIPLWGQQSIMGDTLGTCVMLPLMTSLIVTRVAHGQMRRGKMEALGWSRTSHPVLGWLPPGPMKRGLVLGALCVLVFAPLAFLYLRVLEVERMSLREFILFKACFAALAGALVTPVIALWAIAERPEPQAAAPVAS